MPFVPSDLVPLVQTPGFGLWHYRSPDTRAQITAANYFFAARNTLRPGDVIFVQASDALAILPVRSNAAIGPGVNLDGGVTPLALTRSATKSFSLAQAAQAVLSAIVIAPLLSVFLAGAPIPVSAQVTGPIAQVVVSVRDAQGQLVPPAQTVNVVGGQVTASLPAPPVGSGYRIRITDLAQTGVVATSATFSVIPGMGVLLLETGFRLLQEDGSALALD